MSIQNAINIEWKWFYPFSVYLIFFFKEIKFCSAILKFWRWGLLNVINCTLYCVYILNLKRLTEAYWDVVFKFKQNKVWYVDITEIFHLSAGLLMPLSAEYKIIQIAATVSLAETHLKCEIFYTSG